MFRILQAILGWFVNQFRTSSDNARINNRLNRIIEENARNRNVVGHPDTPVEAYVPRNGARNFIISGENGYVRNRAICAAAYRAYSSARPAIVLHFGNNDLSQMMDNTFRGVSNYVNINQSNPVYDPFFNRGKEEIIDMIMLSSSKSADYNRIGPNGRNLVRCLLGYLMDRTKPGVPYACLFGGCPVSDMRNRIPAAEQRNEISHQVANELMNLYTLGASEMGHVEGYFSIFRQMASRVLVSHNNTSNARNIKTAVHNREVMVIDLGCTTPDTRNSLLALITQEMTNEISGGAAFTIAIDSPPLEQNEPLAQLLSYMSSSCNFVLSSRDIYADTQGNDKFLSSMLARSEVFIALRHTSPATNSFISNYFGKYTKQEISQSFATGRSVGHETQILPGRAMNEIENTTPISMNRILEEEISRAGDRAMFVSSVGGGEIVSVACSDGDPRSTYPIPRGNLLIPNHGGLPRNNNNITGRGGINWLVFTLLFIFFQPFAFVYTFAVCGRRGRIVSVILFILYFVLIAILATVMSLSYQ